MIRKVLFVRRMPWDSNTFTESPELPFHEHFCLNLVPTPNQKVPVGHSGLGMFASNRIDGSKRFGMPEAIFGDTEKASSNIPSEGAELSERINVLNGHAEDDGWPVFVASFDPVACGPAIRVSVAGNRGGLDELIACCSWVMDSGKELTLEPVC